MKKAALMALALCAGAALLLQSLPGTMARYVATVSVPYRVTTETASWYFGHEGEYGYEWEVPASGYYAVQLWGAAGGRGSPWGPVMYMAAGAGGYVAGVLPFTEGDVLTVQVGSKGVDGYDTAGKGNNGGTPVPGDGGYNGGGGGGGYTEDDYAQAGGGGGGATDVRLHTNELQNRVAVAGGGGGAGGGSTRMRPDIGADGGKGAAINADGGWLIPGDVSPNGNSHHYGTPEAGGFGYGGSNDSGGGGGGGGWYGGDSHPGNQGGNGGCSYISGIGWQASDALVSQLPGPDNSYATWIDGYGYAIISYLGTSAPTI